MLALVGAFNMVEGLVVVYGGNVARVDPSRVLVLDLAGWAQVTLTLGALLFSLGIWLSLVTVRVRLMALSVVCVHALTQLGVLAAFPAWALLMISFDVVIIFALTATPAGGAASVARTGSMPADARQAAITGAGRTGTAVGAGRARRGAGDRVGYRPRHQIASADATVVLSQLTEAVIAEAAPHRTAGADDVLAPRALLAGPMGPAGQAGPAGVAGPQPPTATMVGAVAHSAADAASTTPAGTARGVAPPIIGAISGRWPDASLQ
ncbi:hypothetical protein GCM10009835_15130 [Planosporangium flavigriseum]|uniref:DUF7144 domain-containing protein n=2 Tax=Planosporangium flavigriseum TaxID=373681 RepID=A0A8J3PND2_9ACTN|nr:hypothetical protein Pfl04_31820 [Planosporangium flavigriseum]